jgi:hypothetical protein
MDHIIQLGKFKNVSAVSVDQNINIELKNSTKEILSFNESSTIDVSTLFNSERQISESYRIYGRVDFLSIINGMHLDYKKINDFFTPARLGDEKKGLTKNILNCFDVYLCYPLTATTLSAETFIRNYTVVSQLSNFEIYKAGFSNNIFFNNIYAFDFNIDLNLNLNLIHDAFGKPINYVYLLFNYKPTTNGTGAQETVIRSDLNGGTVPLSYATYNIGDVIVGDVVNYVNLNFEETLEQAMVYYVNFPYSGTALQFQYNPFVPIKIRDYSDEISYGNLTGNTETDMEIPSYAIPIDNIGNVIWKTILDNGYIDPISGKGVDFPFLNQRHYVFNTIILPLIPNLNDPHTSAVFTDIHFNTNTGVFTKPAGDLNNLGNKCA